MNSSSFFHSTTLRFRRWSRKSYAVFYSIGRHVTIGRLKNIIADTFIGKQKNRKALPVLNQAIEECVRQQFHKDALQSLASACGFIQMPAQPAAAPEKTIYNIQLFPTGSPVSHSRFRSFYFKKHII